MPTNTKRTIVFTLVIAIVLFLSLSVFFLYQEESYGLIQGSWKVKQIITKGTNVTAEFDGHLVSFMRIENNSVLLPKHPQLPRPYPVKYGHWQFQKKGLFEGIVVILNTPQKYFDGKYEIEIVNHHQPKSLWLRSDSIDMFLIEQYFSIEKPYISFD